MTELFVGLSVPEAEKLVKGWFRECIDEASQKTTGAKTQKLLTRAEACKLLRISLPTLDKLIKSNSLECKRIRGRVLIPERGVDKYLGEVTRNA